MAINLDEAIAAREDEVANYDFNIANFEGLIEKLPSDVPEKLKKYLGKNNGDVIADGTLTEEEALTVSRANFRRDIERRMMLEKLERDRSNAVLEVMLARKAQQQ